MDFHLMAYLAVSVVVLVLVYRSKRVIRFNWNDPRNHQDLRPDGTRVLITNSHAAAMGWIAVQSRPDTAAGNAGLVVLVGWLAGLVGGGILAPAAISESTAVTGVNMAMLVALGLIWGFIVGRMTMTIIVLIIGVLLPLAVVGLIVTVIASFAMGGFHNLKHAIGLERRDDIWSILTPGMDDADWRNFNKRLRQNTCAVFHTVTSLGNVDRARSECDRNWVADQERQRVLRVQKEATQNEERRQLLAKAMAAYEVQMNRLSEGVPRSVTIAKSPTLRGTWLGSTSKCADRFTNLELRLREGVAGVHDGVMLMSRGQFGEEIRYSAFRVRAISDGLNFRLEPGHVIAWHAGEPFAANGQIKEALAPAMFLTLDGTSCNIRLNGILKP